ncbi:DUF5789 family protein [Haloarchaeobius litoreus]|uniref:DUF2795 domain-containing protein n=1 Tax=Haloarchaeobius litoreus TaxID=755306 RepID=A0ABD6DCN6_9EURY|nr:hypothetical protein [Haloarchaeobius litoreus]
MADDNQGRDEKPEDEEPRQRERKSEEVRDRTHEDRAMPGDPASQLGELDAALESQEYPLTTNELVAACGDYEIETQQGTRALEGVLARTDDQTFVSADDVRSRILGLVHR